MGLRGANEFSALDVLQLLEDTSDDASADWHLAFYAASFSSAYR